MKTNRTILVIVFCLVVLIAAILTKQRAPTVTKPSVSIGIASNSVLFATNPTNVTEAIGKTNSVGEEGYSKKFMNLKTGQCAFVGLDNRTITMKDKDGNVLWTVNLGNEAPALGLPVGDIQDGKFFEKQPWLYVAAGRASFTIDIHTGKITGGAMH